MILTDVFCSLINVFDWLQNHLIPCPFKALTSIDCPGCGFQRSFVALLQGDLAKSWFFYPPLIPLLFLFTFAGVTAKFPLKKQALVFRVMVLLVGNFVLLSYFLKMFTHVHL
jgi:hypothetical protein